jgi:hypothetical protein
VWPDKASGNKFEVCIMFLQPVQLINFAYLMIWPPRNCIYIILHLNSLIFKAVFCHLFITVCLISSLFVRVSQINRSGSFAFERPLILFHMINNHHIVCHSITLSLVWLPYIYIFLHAYHSKHHPTTYFSTAHLFISCYDIQCHGISK